MNPNYEKMEHEDQYEYGLRLIETKVEMRPDDLDWQDIIDATGMDCHRDTLRKAVSTTPYSGYEVAQYYKRKMAERGGNYDYSAELDAKTYALRKEATKYYDQRREWNKLVDRVARAENLEDRLLASAQAMNAEYPLVQHKDLPDLESDEAVIVFSDWHYGMVADNIWGQYNTTICKRRVESLLSTAVAKIKLHRPRRLHILLLGDLAHGAIHVSARVASEELVCDQIMQVSEIVAQAISILANEVDETCVHSTYGNHMRTVQNKKESIHADNLEKLIPWWLKQRLAVRPDVRILESEYHEFICLSVCGSMICATHGDLDTVKGAGRLLNTLFMDRYGFGIDYVILADKHHEESFSELGVKTMMAGCLCGPDEYANSKRLYSNPSQLMVFFNKHHGKDAVYEIEVGS